ncbi:MAG TPA: CYCXC family (seleno)protein [Pyrinomonadaceae bacterium]|nr:CYCXC family (seleno)protein [Pyrinomonadaceae bacterium]
MKRKVILVTLILSAVIAAACEASTERRVTKLEPAKQPEKTTAPPKGASAQGARAADGHDHGAHSGEVPAFITTAAELKSLKPTLAPELFAGRQRLGYEAAKAIPQTLAQLPCYCHCDKGFGHKSLQTCFVDDHAAHCAVCIDEALVAYHLEKKEGLRPEQIRERVIAQFSN